jgi:NADH:ubiquinone oxidoreductase subunit 6 (subunit J)
MIYIGTIAGLVMLLAAIICLAFYQTHHTTTKFIILIVMIGLLIFAALSTWKNPNSLRMHSIFLKWSTVVLKDRILSAIYIPLFMLILAMFIGLLIFEFTGFWTGESVDFDPNFNIYH